MLGREKNMVNMAHKTFRDKKVKSRDQVAIQIKSKQ